MKRCENCQTICEDDAATCPSCEGTAFREERICPSCGTRTYDACCPKCGRKLVARKRPEPKPHEEPKPEQVQPIAAAKPKEPAEEKTRLGKIYSKANKRIPVFCALVAIATALTSNAVSDSNPVYIIGGIIFFVPLLFLATEPFYLRVRRNAKTWDAVDRAAAGKAGATEAAAAAGKSGKAAAGKPGKADRAAADEAAADEAVAPVEDKASASAAQSVVTPAGPVQKIK